MKCTVHIWRSIDSDGKNFLLRLRPLYSFEHNRSVETFRNERSLSNRLTAIGFTEEARCTSLTNLRSGSSAMWSHMEIAEDIFESFGQPSGAAVAASGARLLLTA
jgi:hypothetical protein